MAVLGDDWTFLILRQAFWGVTRFENFLSNLAVSRARLSDRLKYLTGIGVMERRPYQTRPERFEYVLSEMGLDLFEMALLIHQWADRWRGDQLDSNIEKRHRPCGAHLSMGFQCASCDEPIAPGTIVEDTGYRCRLVDRIDGLLHRWQRRKAAPKHSSSFDPVSYALEAFGDRWSLLIIDAILSGIHRFDDIQRRLDVARNILTNRLVHLESEGLVTKNAYQDAPPRYDYHPAPPARDLHDVLTATRAWGLRWLYPSDTDAKLVHRYCGQAARPKLVCTSCARPILWEDVDYADPEMKEAKAKMMATVINAGGS